MGLLNPQEWQKLPINLTELCINTTLRCGQSFRWRKSEEGVWSMALHGRILSLRQDIDFLHYRATFPKIKGKKTPLTPPSSTASDADGSDDDTLPLLRHYFNLSPNLTQLYAEWSAADANFKKKAPKFTGVRILKQDAWEALVGFICSSNNNIARISQMVDKLCRNYGPCIGSIDDETYYDFPPASALAKPGVEQKLRDLGFGYRAKYLYQTACMIAEKDSGWLDGLRNPESPVLGVEPSPAGAWSEEGREGYRHAHEELLALQGVGPKVADCVCLMGLGWGEAVPVDTHVWQIAVRDYRFGKGKHSSLTKATYDAVANKFRSLWGKEAGWAHSVLFTADLRAFAERLVAKTESTSEKEVAVKKEEVEVEEKETVVLVKQVKREPELKLETVTEIKETVRRSKRRRQA
ncbi:DNA glycosylase [Myriangium duriaei CBS 260.36]|uniref:DNA-(apurinic or apyrimidinic site) lyase n=1 Tax=Myriangium duriaei CBS 260.36 TaxID=1168546 RepID=A0A9P4IY07_9PEZI|nr:DNA glycosylase [Myriangium duriaei CBS 260.36]